MRPSDDLLALLLPEADEAGLELARRVTNFARLFACDAQASGSPTVSVDVERASVELERHAREAVLEASLDLLRAHLHALLPADSFAWFGATGMEHQLAWSILDEHRCEPRPAAHVPAPGEDAGSVVRRLLESAGRFGLEPHALALWRSRLAWVAEGPDAGRRALDALAGEALPPELRAECRIDRAAVRLDRGDVRGALDVLREEDRGAPSARGPRLAAWCRLLLDPGGGAASSAPVDPADPAPGSEAVPGDSGGDSDGGPFPGALVPLRETLAIRAVELAGAPSTWSGPPAPLPDVCDRKAHGACALAVFARVRGTAVAVHLSVAPGLAGGVERWVSERDGSWLDPASPEHRLLLEALPVQRHARGERAPRGALGLRSRAVALAPILDDAGEVAGWVHLELEHHLVPGPQRLVALAAAWRARVLEASRVPPCPAAPDPWSDADSAAEIYVHEARAAGFPAAASSAASPDEGEEGRILRGLVRELGLKTSHRRWWGFACSGGAPRLLVAGGSGLTREGDADADRRGEGGGGGTGASGARALARALATGGVVRFDAPEPGLSVHAGAASGVVLPVVLGQRVLGLVAIESERRRDFQSLDLQRARELAGARALALRAACFGAWHGRRFGAAVTFPSSGPDFAAFTSRLIAIGHSRAPLVLSGPSGCGKRVLARWIHFEAVADEPWHEEDDRLGAEGLSALLRDAQGTVLLHGLEPLDAEAQRLLLRHVEAPPAGAPRLLIDARRPLADSVERGDLRGDLGTRLERLQVFVPPLADRRVEIPALVPFLARRMAREARTEAPVFEDDALALLWRQPWEGNLRSLENVIFKLVLHAERGALDAEHVHALLRPYGVELATRLPSKNPRRLDLLAALATTRKATGRLNKRRAAAYLGWDPDTLVARMQDANLGDDPPDPEAWGAPPATAPT